MTRIATTAIAISLAFLGQVATATAAPARISVVPRSSAADQAVHIRVTGLRSHAVVRVRLAVRDAEGRRWYSSALFHADTRGTVDLDRAAASSGSYAGRWGMGLVASLTARSSGRFAWKPSGAHRFRIEVRFGARAVAAGSFLRSLPGRVDERPVTAGGLYGRYYAPRGPAARSPALLVLGGSEGGLPSVPLLTMLAGRGYPTLSLSYFRAPGLPPTLESIPLEYFERALEWLRAQPQVDPARMVVLGVSFGSQAAQLVGVHYPNLVGAVVASVPSNVATCGQGCSGPAWTFGGNPVPFTREGNNPYPADEPGAVIPDELIRGPLFLVCGGLDSAWVSCLYSRAIASRLREQGHPYPDVRYSYPNAGHHVGGLLPYTPFAPRWLYFNQVDEQARADVWPRLLSFLRRL
jgi:dienelactone hydrolase